MRHFVLLAKKKKIFFSKKWINDFNPTLVCCSVSNPLLQCIRPTRAPTRQGPSMLQYTNKFGCKVVHFTLTLTHFLNYITPANEVRIGFLCKTVMKQSWNSIFWSTLFIPVVHSMALEGHPAPILVAFPGLLCHQSIVGRVGLLPWG
jgi:hypothetical protein